MKKRIIALLLALCLAATLFAGCTGGDDETQGGADAPKICMVVFSGYIYQENKKSQNGDIN